MRKLEGHVGWAVAIWAAAAAIFQLYTAYIGYLEPREQRSLHLLLFLPLAFLLYPAHPTRSPQDRPSALDWLLAGLAILPNAYSYFEAHRINMRLENVTPLLPAELVLGTLAILLFIEALRRAVTPILAGLLLIALLYLFNTEHMPGMWNYRDLGVDEIVEDMFLVNGEGMYGTITGISATMVAVFIAFGAFVEGSGVGRLFSNLGSRVAGRYSGGPAKVAVLTSAMFGTMSGSSSSNVFATGSFTIPMMKKLGYRPAFAGGVEAAASVGGQIMPPIMGAGAFIMAEITNIPYRSIIVAALLGACCYFFMVLISVHLEARKLGLRGLDESELPTWRAVLDDLHLLIPIVVLMGLLTLRYSPHFAAFYSILATVAATWLRRHTRLGPRQLFRILANAGRNITSIAVACVGAGMIIASLTVTGLVISLGTIITQAAGGELWLAAILLMLTTIALGMGVPTTAAYVITAAIGAPTLISQFGVPVLGAHLFVFYFAILADATPPVSIASYAAASIARAHPIMTGLQALRLSIAGFVVGYSYLYTPALMMDAPFFEVLGQILVNLTGLTILAAGLTGYLNGPIALPLRPLLFAAGLAITLLEIYPVWPRVLIALVALAALYYLPGVFALGRKPAVVKPAGAESQLE
jgi:TRAP transporter 4TM/12TM fusion protein